MKVPWLFETSGSTQTTGYLMIWNIAWITPSPVRLGLPFLQVFDQTFLFVLYLTMRATRPPISREVPILRQTDRWRPPQNVAVPSSLSSRLWAVACRPVTRTAVCRPVTRTAACQPVTRTAARRLPPSHKPVSLYLSPSPSCWTVTVDTSVRRL